MPSDNHAPALLGPLNHTDRIHTFHPPVAPGVATDQAPVYGKALATD